MKVLTIWIGLRVVQLETAGDERDWRVLGNAIEISVKMQIILGDVFLYLGLVGGDQMFRCKEVAREKQKAGFCKTVFAALKTWVG